MVSGPVELDTLLRNLGDKEIVSVLIEGGGDILGQALDRGLIDKIQIYVAPLFTGGPTHAFAGKGGGATSAALRVGGVCFVKNCEGGWGGGFFALPRAPPPPKIFKGSRLNFWLN